VRYQYLAWLAGGLATVLAASGVAIKYDGASWGDILIGWGVILGIVTMIFMFAALAPERVKNAAPDNEPGRDA